MQIGEILMSLFYPEVHNLLFQVRWCNRFSFTKRNSVIQLDDYCISKHGHELNIGKLYEYFHRYWNASCLTKVADKSFSKNIIRES